MSGNRLLTGRAENFEARNSYKLQLQVKDSGSPQLTVDILVQSTEILCQWLCFPLDGEGVYGDGG